MRSRLAAAALAGAAILTFTAGPAAATGSPTVTPNPVKANQPVTVAGACGDHTAATVAVTDARTGTLLAENPVTAATDGAPIASFDTSFETGFPVGRYHATVLCGTAGSSDVADPAVTKFSVFTDQIAGDIDGEIDVDFDELAPGDMVQVTADGFEPGAEFTATVYSTPMPLSAGIADADGNIEFTAVLPLALEAGYHTLVVDGGGRTLAAVFAVSATDDLATDPPAADPTGDPTSDPTSDPTGTPTADPTGTPTADTDGELAETGASSVILALAALVVIVAGGSMTAYSRWR